jgi:bidirectional [NiFe] hydrogenase diaphorase subunit
VELSDLLDIAAKEKQSRPQYQIRCCTAACCLSANSAAVLTRLQNAVRESGLTDRVRVSSVGCMRLCCQGPLVQVDPNGELYQQVTPDHAASIVDGLKGGTVTAQRGDPDSPFFALQASVILQNSDRIEPERIETYIAAEGYQALHHVLLDLTP